MGGVSFQTACAEKLAFCLLNHRSSLRALDSDPGEKSRSGAPARTRSGHPKIAMKENPIIHKAESEARHE